MKAATIIFSPNGGISLIESFFLYVCLLIQIWLHMNLFTVAHICLMKICCMISFGGLLSEKLPCFPASTFSLFSVQSTWGVYVLFATRQCHHHRRLQKRENNDITILAKITKRTKKNQDILAIKFSRLVEVISVDIFCMKCPKATQSKIKSKDLRGRPCSRVSAEGSAQLFGVC